MANSNGTLEAPEDTETCVIAESAPIITLTQRMMLVRKGASGVGKEEIEMQNKERTKKWTIKAHTIEGVLHGIRSLLDEHGIWLQPQLITRQYSNNRCDVEFDFTFENVDDPDDVKTIKYAGSGTDNTDKGFAKAGTNALKEMLKKVFLITDREDAKEEEERVEYRTPDDMAREVTDKANDVARAALEKWGNNLREALKSAPTLEDIARLERENKKMLMSAEVAPVTRDFFIDLIQSQKAKLSKAKNTGDLLETTEE